MRVLIVEDEARLADSLRQLLAERRWAADVVYNGPDGYDYAVSGQYDAVVLDVMLPGMNGFEVVRRLRAAKCAVPVLLLTARDEITDKVQGLDCGADDYMTKPFAPEELVARLNALTRRQGEVITDKLTFADLSLDLATCTLSSGGRSVRLGYKEFEVLRLLMSNPGAVLSKDDLIMKVWGADSEAEDNNVEAYISFLRKKLSFLGSKVTISTLRRLGYCLEAAS